MRFPSKDRPSRGKSLIKKYWLKLSMKTGSTNSKTFFSHDNISGICWACWQKHKNLTKTPKWKCWNTPLFSTWPSQSDRKMKEWTILSWKELQKEYKNIKNYQIGFFICLALRNFMMSSLWIIPIEKQEKIWLFGWCISLEPAQPKWKNISAMLLSIELPAKWKTTSKSASFCSKYQEMTKMFCCISSKTTSLEGCFQVFQEKKKKSSKIFLKSNPTMKAK